MYIRKIVLSNYKNIKELRLDFSSKINWISGNNGAGKTNLLDAVHYLSMTKSYFNVSDRFTFLHGTDETALNGVYRLDDGTEDRVSVFLKKGGEKQIKRNDKSYGKISEHIGRFPVVMVSPYDTSLINDASEERRRFLNMILSQVDHEYLQRIQKYNHILQQRNRLLKMPYQQDELLDTMGEQLSLHAGYIYEKRNMLCRRLQESASYYYSMISGGREETGISYRSDLENGPLYETLAKEREKDKVLKFTSCGIHRDEMVLSLSGYPIRKCGSQGQQKTFLVALKMAQYAIMKEMYSGISPILLLDDLFDKLDMERVGLLLKMVSGEKFGQIFISDSNKVRMDRILSSLEGDHSCFVMESGICRRLM